MPFGIPARRSREPRSGVSPRRDQRAFVPLGTQTGDIPLDPRAAGLNSIEPRVRCFGSGAFDHGANAPLGTLSGVKPLSRGFDSGDDQGCLCPWLHGDEAVKASTVLDPPR
jgi:hypothetical protein